MSEEPISWCCRNRDCRSVNLIDRELVERAIKKGKNVNLICGTCGFVNRPDTQAGIIEKEDANWCACIPLTDSSRVIPNGVTPGGYTDANGEIFSRIEFLKKYLVDPETWWAWKSRGFPKPEKPCKQPI